jgi:hypothetical protein
MSISVRTVLAFAGYQDHLDSCCSSKVSCDISALGIAFKNATAFPTASFRPYSLQYKTLPSVSMTEKHRLTPSSTPAHSKMH